MSRLARFATLLAFVAPFAVRPADADLSVDAGRGAVTVYTPAGHDPEVPTPLVLLLHGYATTGAQQEAYMQFRPQMDDYGFLYAHPDGLRDFLGLPYWEATDACDSFPDVDDSGYLRALIDTISDTVAVDPRRVYLVGHSNGGCMAFRMACEHADAVAAIASLAGSTWLDPSRCTPSEPVHVLEIHGTHDAVSRFGGGCVGDCYPGAIDTLEPWLEHNGCDRRREVSSVRLDLTSDVPGHETVVVEADRGCDPGGSVTLWGIRRGAHTPALSDSFTSHVLDHLFAHPKAD